MLEIIGASIGIWICGALIVTGLLQWAKGIIVLPAKYKWIYGFLSVGVALGAAATNGGLILWNWLGIWAVSQLGYENILQRFSNPTKEL